MEMLHMPCLLLICTAMWPAATFGAAPEIDGEPTAAVADKLDSVMIPAYTVSDTDGDNLTYNIDPAVDGLSIETDRGVITTTATVQSGNYTLVVTNSNGQNTSEVIHFTVFTDEDDPTLSDNLVANVPESVAVGTVIPINITVEDADTVKGDGFTYEISGQGSNKFDIGYFSGVLRTKSELDAADTTPTYTIDVTVRDSKQSKKDKGTIVLTVTANRPPVCDAENIKLDIKESLKVGDRVTSVDCSDPDIGNTVSYSIEQGNAAGDFNINAVSGVIRVAKGLDHDRTDQYVLKTKATDTSLDTLTTVTINVLHAGVVKHSADYTCLLSLFILLRLL